MQRKMEAAQTRKTFDITEIVRGIIEHKFKEHPDLYKEFTAEMRDNKLLKLFVAEVCDETFKQNAQPVTAMQISMCYGMVLGVLAERHRRRIVI
jgi:hypothetical protein